MNNSDFHTKTILSKLYNAIDINFLESKRYGGNLIEFCDNPQNYNCETIIKDVFQWEGFLEITFEQLWDLGGDDYEGEEYYCIIPIEKFK